MMACDTRPRRGERSCLRPGLSGLATALLAAMAIVSHGTVVNAQPAWQPHSPQYVQCPAPGQPLLRIPELVAENNRLHATILLNNNVQQMFLGANDPSQCLPQDVR